MTCWTLRWNRLSASVWSNTLDGSSQKISQHTCEISSQIPRFVAVVIGKEEHVLSASTRGAGSKGGCCVCGKESAHIHTIGTSRPTPSDCEAQTGFLTTTVNLMHVLLQYINKSFNCGWKGSRQTRSQNWRSHSWRETCGLPLRKAEVAQVVSDSTPTSQPKKSHDFFRNHTQVVLLQTALWKAARSYQETSRYLQRRSRRQPGCTSERGRIAGGSRSPRQKYRVCRRKDCITSFG